MTAVRYAPLDGGFVIESDYEGHTEVAGSWTSPTFVLRPVDSGWSVLEHYRDDLVGHGFAPDATLGPRPAWWAEPVFCGWGAQCARAVARNRAAEHPADHRPAPSFARQDVYDEFLTVLADNELEPGTIVIDDRWQSAYGTGEVDRVHWPDLRGWIDARHAEGRRVLLWWKAWDPEGVPAEECVRDADGAAVTVDAGSPAYRDRLARVIHHLLSPDGLDADGLKIDFTQRGPSGAEPARARPACGASPRSHRLLRTVAVAARAARQDPLLIAHAVHPSFADVSTWCGSTTCSSGTPRASACPSSTSCACGTRSRRARCPEPSSTPTSGPCPIVRSGSSTSAAQAQLGVPALYYLESIDNSGEPILPEHLALVGDSWRTYRERGR